MTQLAFQIDGAWLTNHARDCVIEGRWDHSMRILTEGLEGMTADIALSILRGEQRLYGVNDINIEPDASLEYRKELKRAFDGTFVYRGQYYRPYAVVTAWCKLDIHEPDEDRFHICNPISPLATVRRAKFSRQPLIYADDPRTDIALEARIDGEYQTVLCHLVKNFPHMIYPTSLSVGAAVEQIGNLRETGAQTLPAETFPTSTRSVLDAPSVDDDDAFQKRHEADLARYREEIAKQAGDDYFELHYTVNGAERVINVPTAPFENWALWRTRGAHLAKPWQKVTRSGLKMINDDPYHTDWMLGAGLGLDAMDEIDSTLSTVVYEMNFDLQHTLLTTNAAVLSSGPVAYGRVVHPKPDQSVGPDEIAVIPSASPRYLQAAITAKAVIVEQGGALAHLVSVAREQNITIMRVENAKKLYPEGEYVTADPIKGQVMLSPYKES